MIRKRHPVKRHHFKFLSINLQVQIAIRGGIHDAPKLPLVRSNLDAWAKCAIHGEDFVDLLRCRPTSLRWNGHQSPEFHCVRIVLNGTAAHNQHALTKPRYFGNITFCSLDDNRSRHSVQHLPVTLAVGMSVIPEQARRMIARNLNRVVQDLPRHRQHSEHVILRGVRRNCESVKM